MITIYAFYPVCNDLGWERDEFKYSDDITAFKTLWENRRQCNVRFYHSEDCRFFMSDLYFQDRYDMERDYNNENLDGGLWLTVLALEIDDIRQITKL